MPRKSAPASQAEQTEAPPVDALSGQPSNPEDPLADLREPADGPTPLEGGPAPQEGPEEPQDALSRPLATQEAWDAARAEMIAGWHADTTAMGFLHRGSACACHYLAGVALTAIMPTEDADPASWPDGAPEAPQPERFHQGA